MSESIVIGNVCAARTMFVYSLHHDEVVTKYYPHEPANKTGNRQFNFVAIDGTNHSVKKNICIHCGVIYGAE